MSEKIKNYSLKSNTDTKKKEDGRIRYTVPQRITQKKDITVYFRVSDVFRNVRINIKNGDKTVFSKKKNKLAPGEMESIRLKADALEDASELMLELEEV